MDQRGDVEVVEVAPVIKKQVQFAPESRNLIGAVASASNPYDPTSHVKINNSDVSETVSSGTGSCTRSRACSGASGAATTLSCSTPALSEVSSAAASSSMGTHSYQAATFQAAWAPTAIGGEGNNTQHW